MKQAFVIGHPIAHSRSPVIHRHWLEKYGIPGSYEAIDVAPEALPRFIDRVRGGEVVGGNVTIPLKELVFPLCDNFKLLARTIGAVNTLVAQDGRITGFNTDYMGFLGNLDQQVPGWSAGLHEAVVLGAGGAARAVLVALAERGVGTVHVLNRTLAKAEAIAREFEGPVRAGRLDSLAALLPRCGLLVNTTSIGMHGTGFDDLPLQYLPARAIVTDLVYVPLETRLLRAARAHRLRAVDGLGMLLHQAVPGFEAWFGVRPQVTAELRALVESTLGDS